MCLDVLHVAKLCMHVWCMVMSVVCVVFLIFVSSFLREVECSNMTSR